MHEYGIVSENDMPCGTFDGIVLCVRHDEFSSLGAEQLRSRLARRDGFIYDLEEVLPVALSNARV